MRTVLPLHPSDVSARARILDSAMRCFAERGYAQATVRDIAARADVSAALVTHHFGGKAALQAACDTRIEQFLSEKRDVVTDPASVLELATTIYGPYLAAMLNAPTDAASGLFARLHALARDVVTHGVASGRFRASSDPDAQAAALVVLGVAPFLLQRRLDEWAGPDAGISRLAVPLAEIYTDGLLADGDLVESAAEATGAAS